MAKLVLSDITSGNASSTLINANNALVEAIVEKALMLDGTGDNVMTDVLDMNGFNINNIGNPITIVGWVWKGSWVTATAYVIGDVVENGGTSYICIVAHTSGTFATDLTAVKWQLIADAGLPTQSGNSGKFLTTDGTTASWGVIAATYVAVAGDTMTGDLVMSAAAINHATIVTVASATAPAIGAAASNSISISGTTQIDGFDDLQVGCIRLLYFEGILQLTHSATLVLPGAANITTAAGDTCMAQQIATGTQGWRIFSYQRANGTSVVGGSAASTTGSGIVELATTAEYKTGTDTTRAVTVQAARQGHRVYGSLTDISTGATSYNFATSIPSWVTRLVILFEQLSLNSTDQPIIQLGDSGGIETTVYLSKSSTISTVVGTSTATNGFVLRSFNAANIITGKMVLDLMDTSTNLWVQDHSFNFENLSGTAVGSGRKALSGILTQLTLTTVSGANTFDGTNSRITYYYE